jgi:hypothetical protein
VKRGAIIGSLAITPDLEHDFTPDAPLPERVIPVVPAATPKVAPPVPAPRVAPASTTPKVGPAATTPKVAPAATAPKVAPAARPPKVAPPKAGDDGMTLRGEYWELCYQQRRGVVPDCRGLRYIALLVRDTSGGRDPIHAKELATLATGEPSVSVELEMEDEVLDTKAKTQLMKRLEEIAFERGRAVAIEDFTRATQLDDEYEQIADELGRAGAKRGASRKNTAFVHTGEKARKAVAKAISTAVARIAAHPDLEALAEHFGSSLRKGQWLSYTGGADWHIDFSTPLPRK